MAKHADRAAWLQRRLSCAGGTNSARLVGLGLRLQADSRVGRPAHNRVHSDQVERDYPLLSERPVLQLQ
jgi:hypothetical protein